MSCSRAAGPGEVPGQGDQFAGGAGGGQFLGGFDAQRADQAVGHGVECGDHRVEEPGEGVLGSGDEARDLERLGDRPVLGHQFADHHLHGGGQQHADDDRHAGHGAVGDADGRERAVEQPGQRRFGEHADDERGDGDPELGAGELEGQLLEGLDDPVGAPVATAAACSASGRSTVTRPNSAATKKPLARISRNAAARSSRGWS